MIAGFLPWELISAADVKEFEGFLGAVAGGYVSEESKGSAARFWD